MKRSRREAIVILGAGALQKPVVDLAHSEKLAVLGTNVRPHEAAGLNLEGLVNVDATKISQVVGAVSTWIDTFDIRRVLAFSDFGLRAEAHLSQLLGIAGPPVDSVNSLLSKSRFRARIDGSKGLSIPSGVVTSGSQLVTEGLTYPLIVKPDNQSGSVGVQTCYDEVTLKSAIRRAQKWSSLVIVEEVVRGRHFDVSGVLVDGDLIEGGVLERFFWDSSHHAPTGGRLLEKSERIEFQMLCYRFLLEAASAFNIRNGAMKLDLIQDDEGRVWVIEASTRLHGLISSWYVMEAAGRPSAVRFLVGRSATNHAQADPSEEKPTGWLAAYTERQGRTVRELAAAEKLTIHNLIISPSRKLPRIGSSTDAIREMFVVSGESTGDVDSFFSELMECYVGG